MEDWKIAIIIISIIIMVVFMLKTPPSKERLVSDSVVGYCTDPSASFSCNDPNNIFGGEYCIIADNSDMLRYGVPIIDKWSAINRGNI